MAYFGPLLGDGKKMFDAAPATLFTIAAGNDSLDNDLYPDFPAGILAENKIVVAATLGYSALADFSNFGARSVDVAAPGVAITSTAPTNTYISLSGTSQATPYVANIVAALKDINPALNFRGLKAIVLGTVDVKTWLSGKVLTSGIVNKARALKAAELSLSLPLETAIANAKNLVLDVPVSKSFFKKASGFTLNIKPIRPSLLLKKL
jgi:subtilisin family serine protease